MESVFRHEVWERKVSVVGAELLDKYTVYIIDVTDGRHRWTVKHRYSDFHDLHEKMTAEKKVERQLLPPKKILGKNSRSLVERRQKELELYLQTLLLQFPEATPPPLSCFLDFHLYEINGITAALAEDLFNRGEQLLMAGQVFCLRPVQLYSVSQQLRLAKPTCFNGDARTDLGHILDFTCRLRYLKVCGSRGPVGTSNIQESSLPFDLSVFKSLQQIEISDCSAQQIGGLSSLRSSLVTMSVHRSTESMMSILVPEAIEFSQWEPEGADSGCPVTAIIPVWRHLTTLDMSHNCIHAIDGSVKLIPKVEFLDLSYNQLSVVENLQHLYNLVHVDLSYNGLRILEAAHTRLGNIKTLNLSGNQLEELSGLSKLYSLVNLDLSHNRLAQLEEIRNISCLPCLEKLNMSSNPICIIPDYRTKVLAQFGERAAEVCLDSRVTTEKELDTVEVLKAIRKAKEVKEVKDRMSSSDRKVSEVTRPSSTCPSQQAASSSPEVTSGEEVPVLPVVLPPLFPAPPLNGSNTLTHLPSTHTAKVQQPTTDRFEGPYRGPTSSTWTAVCSICSSSSRPCWSCSAPWCPLLPASLSYLSSSNKDFISQLSQHLSSTVWDRRKKKDEEKEEQRSKVRGQSNVEETQVGSPRTGSRDGYFEMGLEDSVEETPGSSPRFPPAVVTEESDEKEVVRVSGVLWCCCVRVEPEEVKQSRACLVLTDQLLGLLHLSDHFTCSSQGAELLQDPVVEDVMSSLQLDLLVPYSQILVSSSPPLLGSFLSFRLGAAETRWYIFSGAEELQKTRSELGTLLQDPPELLRVPQLLPPPLLKVWGSEGRQGAPGGLPVFLQFWSEPRAPLKDMWSERLGLPGLVFLTHGHLWLLKMDLAEKEGVHADHHESSGSKLVHVPLISVALHPRHRPGYRLCLDPQHQHRSPHSVELFIRTQKLLMVFPLVQDQTRFLAELDHQRTSLKGCKMLVLPQPCRPCPHPGEERPCPHPGEERPCPHPGALVSGFYGSKDEGCCSSDWRHHSSSSWDVSLGLEEDRPCPHLLPGPSPALDLLAGLTGKQLLSYFHRYVALSQVEEVRQVLWLSAVLYSSPETELTCCLLLSTDSIYFLLEDCPSILGHHSVLDLPLSGDSDTCLCCCLSIKLCELQGINVGLFDQYFRVVGSSANQVVSCLSRDSYRTSVFLQELMSVLSNQQHLPPPEPSEQDFYSQFTHSNSGKMQNYELIHSSRVKFVYPSDEEIGDLTFIVAERKTSPSSSWSSCNILLYLLVFQVQTVSQEPGASSSPVLHPRTLILTSTDVFLLDEDYVSYPLPDFAKEPPSRERYQLREARRIRDLDRVLLGYQTYPQALTLVFDDLPGPDLLCHLTMDHFSMNEGGPSKGGVVSRSPEGEVQWCVFVPGADGRERLIALLARQWEALCSRELPVELTG